MCENVENEKKCVFSEDDRSIERRCCIVRV